MKIKLTSIYVDDQEKALAFYTDVLGLKKKADFGNAGYRWLTVVSPEDAEGTELQLALNNNPAGKAYQQALYQQGQPAFMLFSDNIKADAETIAKRGGKLKMPPTDVTGSTIAQIEDGVGNIVQITELKRW
jgi:predicted enzyme related to lactoylglutathione lyase